MEVAEAVAFLRLLGATQELAAKEVGVGTRTVRAWEGSDWWPKAREAARKRWFRQGNEATMRGILGALDRRDAEGYTMMRWWAERRIEELAPPRQKHDVNAKIDIPYTLLADLTEEEAREFNRILTKLTAVEK